MNLEKKGCVYFFRHSGLTPVKIGFSNSASPIERFECFRTYAPYGAELMGFIVTDNANELERTIHSKFSSFRIKGEWFEITESNVNDCILLYSNVEFVSKKNEFEIAWANKINELSPSKTSNEELLFFEKLSLKLTNDYQNKLILNMGEIYGFFEGKIEKNHLRFILKKHKIKPSAHRSGGQLRKGVKFFIKK